MHNTVFRDTLVRPMSSITGSKGGYVFNCN